MITIIRASVLRPYRKSRVRVEADLDRHNYQSLRKARNRDDKPSFEASIGTGDAHMQPKTMTQPLSRCQWYAKLVQIN